MHSELNLPNFYQGHIKCGDHLSVLCKYSQIMIHTFSLETKIKYVGYSAEI